MSRPLSFLILYCLTLLGLTGCSATHNRPADAGHLVTSPSRASAPMAKAAPAAPMPRPRIPFIANRGQADEPVKFYAPIAGGTVFVTATGQITYSLPGAVLTEELVGATVATVTGKGETRTRVNVLRGKDPAAWRTNLPTYDAVSLGEAYAGVDVELQASGTSVEKLFYVKPGGEPAQIRITLTGGRGIAVTERGELDVATTTGSVRFTRPIAYQEAVGKREPVDVAYVVEGDHYGFRVGAYDRSRLLVIDPLLKTTFLGGEKSDTVSAVVEDGGRNVYVAGITASAEFPGVGRGSADSFLNPFGNFDGFVAKLDPELSVVLVATFLGGSGDDTIDAIAIDGAGNLYVTGRTDSSDFPGIGPTSALTEPGGGFDAFIARLNTDLTTVHSTFLGGTGSDDGRAIALDGAGNVYVAGRTTSSDFPGIDAASADSTYDSFEAFVAKLDANLSTILAATYLGGSSGDEANGLALDGAEHVYVVGLTRSPDFPGVGPRAGSADFTFAESEAFVTKLDANLGTILAATFLGGSASDTAYAVAINAAGHVYVAGATDSADFPGVGAASADSTFAGSFMDFSEGFIAKLDANLGIILAATFLGGSSLDGAVALGLDGAGNVYVAGSTGSLDFPGISAGSADPMLVNVETFVAKLNADLTNVMGATFLGGSGNDFARALAVNAAGTMYVTGTTIFSLETGGTSANDFPGVGPGSADSTYGGFDEGFVARLEALEISGYSAIQKLKNFIDSCFPCPPTVKQTLLRHVETAMRHVLEDNARGAVGTMNVFIADTERFVRSRQLPADIGRELTRRARQIIAELSP